MLHDTALVFARAMRQLLRNPFWLIFGLIQPILYLGLFGPLLIQVAKATPGRSSCPRCWCRWACSGVSSSGSG